MRNPVAVSPALIRKRFWGYRGTSLIRNSARKKTGFGVTEVPRSIETALIRNRVWG